MNRRKTKKVKAIMPKRYTWTEDGIEFSVRYMPVTQKPKHKKTKFERTLGRL